MGLRNIILIANKEKTVDAGPSEGKLSVDPQGILAHLLADIAAFGERVLSAEQHALMLNPCSQGSPCCDAGSSHPS